MKNNIEELKNMSNSIFNINSTNDIYDTININDITNNMYYIV